ncbi:MAG: hypothetical protein ACP5NF_08550 [Thermoanaerobaculum sp.]
MVSLGTDELFRAARRRDGHDLPARYPNGWDAGDPHESYGADEPVFR